MNEDVPTTTVLKILKLGDFLLSFCWLFIVFSEVLTSTKSLGGDLVDHGRETIASLHRGTWKPGLLRCVCVFLLVVVQMDTDLSFVEGIVILGCCFQWRCFVFFFGVCEGHRIVSLFSLKPFVRQINQQTNPHIVVVATSSGSPIINMAVTASNLHLKMVSQPWWHAHHAGHDLWSAFLTTDLMFQIL